MRDRTIGDAVVAFLPLVDGGTLRIEIADRRPLDQSAAVHEASDNGRLHGKTLLIPALRQYPHHP